jgi:hypothetical protein
LRNVLHDGWEQTVPVQGAEKLKLQFNKHIYKQPLIENNTHQKPLFNKTYKQTFFKTSFSQTALI